MFGKIKNFFNVTNITEPQKPENEKANEILKDFEISPNIDKIPDLYKFLLINDLVLKEKIIKTIINFSSTLKPEQLLHLYDIFRERTSFDWNSNVDWKNININEILIENMSEFEKIYFIGVASFHPNGYFREKCLNELIKYNSGFEIPFLIIKLTDWVNIIKNKANIELEKRITNQNIKFIIQNLYLLYKLKEKKRNNNDKIITLSKQLLLNYDSFEQVLPDLNNVSKRTKQFCYEILLCRKLSIEQMINYSKNDCDVLKSFLDNKNKKIIIASLKALSILDYTGNLNIFLKYLQSNYNSISNFSAKIIESKINEFNEIDIYSIYKTTNNENVKFNSMKLLTKLQKWNSIVYILEFIESENQLIKQTGFKYLISWEDNFNKSLTICSGKLKEKIKNMICKSKNLDETHKKILYFML